MPYTTQSSDFWGWYLRHNTRTIWKHLADAGIDVFAAGPSNNTQAFLDLTNVLPAMNGGFNRRWGTNLLGTTTTLVAPVRTFLYNVPQDVSNPTGTENTNLWIGTDNQKFICTYENGTSFGGTHFPTDFAVAGEVTAVVSRNWFYYGNAVAPMRKVNPSFTSVSTSDSLCGIALPVDPVATSPRNYPSVWSVADKGTPITAGPFTGVLDISIVTAGSGLNDGLYPLAATGPGTGLIAYVQHSGGVAVSVTINDPGVGFTSVPIISDSFVPGGGTAPTFLATINPVTPTQYVYSGINYKNTDTLTITDPTGTGSGASATLQVDAAGRIVGLASFVGGSNYGAANATINTTTGTGGSIVLYVAATPESTAVVSGSTTTTNVVTTGPIVGWDLGGNMSFAGGREYAVALQNSITGHTSDVYISNAVVGPTSAPNLALLNEGTKSIITSTNATAGFSGYGVGISVPATGLDPQVDTIVLLAGADGQGLSTLYEVTKIPLARFTAVPSTGTTQFYQYWYLDTLPDTYNDYNVSGPTLLASDIWSQIDSTGNINGISLNTPPPLGLKYFTVHQGRMFASDGKTLFFSKSLDEVTTSTGLITSKWEEAWPGDYQLPIALNNEEIIGIKSDGTNLHVGTNKSIFTVYGTDPTNFDVPSVAFAQTGILSNDTWNVIYAEGQPSGFVWITKDLKVIHSDFATYREIGTGIYPILKNLDLTQLESAKVMSLTDGPYNLVLLSVALSGSSNVQPEILIWESRLQKWYHWILPATFGTSSIIPTSMFVYQVPAFAAATGVSPFAKGKTNLYLWGKEGSPWNATANWVFDKGYLNDSSIAIPWSVQTSWQDLGDSTAIKTINEIEVTSDDGPLTVTLLGATSQAQFDAGGSILKTGQTVAGPLSALGTLKFYCAGAQTAAKYYSLKFVPVSPGTGTSVLTSFSLEAYPMARI